MTAWNVIGRDLMVSSLVRNRVEYYRNVSLVIIIKGTFPHLIYGRYCKQYVCLTKLSTNVWYLQEYLVSKCQLCSRILQPLPFSFL